MSYRKWPSDVLRRSIYFDATAIAAADRLAKAEGVNRSQLVSRAVIEYANQQKQA
jgi:metal-responsive CopG/Arc/MetJ family transcriptional regulator